MASQLEAIGLSKQDVAAARETTPVAADESGGISRGARRVLAGLALLLVSSLALLVGFDANVAAERYVRNDVVFRGADSIESYYRYRTADPSPFSIALGADLFVERSLRDGRLPLWDRHQGGGYSPWVQGNLGMLFPLRILASLFPPGQVQSVVLLSSLAACFALTLLFLQQLGLSTAGSALGAGIYSLSGFSVGQLLLDGVAIYLFLPWILLAAGAWQESRTPWRFAHLVVAFGLGFLSGHVMVLASVFLGVGSWLALGWLLGERDWRDPVGLILAGAWGSALAAPTLLPFVLHFRSAWNYKTETAQGQSYEVADLEHWLGQLRAIAFDGSEFFLDAPGFYLYLGLPIVALAITGAILSLRERGRRPVALFLAASFLICLPGPWMALFAGVPPLVYVRTYYLFGVLVFAVAVACAVALDALERRSPWRLHPVLLGAIVLLLLAESVLRGWPALTPAASEPLPESGAYRFLRDDPEVYRVTGLWGHTHLPNLAHVSGIEDLRLIAVVHNARYHAWFELVDPAVLDKNFPTGRITNELGSPLIGAFNVKYAIQGRLPHHYYVTQLTRDDPFGVFHPGASPVNGDGWRLAYEDSVVRIHRLEENLRPRAYFAPSVVMVPKGIDSAASWLRDHPERLSTTVVVEADDPELRARIARLRSGDSQTIELRYPSDAEVSLQVRTQVPALLVLNDIYEAGWRARIDGAPAEILPVNLISRGLVIEPGEHLIEMSYRPPGLVAGALVAGIAATFLGVGCGVHSRRARAQDSEAA